MATDSGLSSATKTSTKPFLLLHKQTNLCLPDPHPTEQSLPKTKASWFTDLNCSFPNTIFNAVSHPKILSPFPLRSAAVSVGSRQGWLPGDSTRLSWQRSSGGGRLAASASAAAPSGKSILCTDKSGYQLSYTAAKQELLHWNQMRK